MKITSLDDQLQLEQVGAKAYNLSLLKTAGFSVPEGFIVPVSFFHAHLSDPQHTESRLKEELKKVNFSDKKEWMVRSSAIGEDSEDASFAGQLESYSSPNDIESLLQNIYLCWGSSNSKRVHSYMESKNVKLGGVAVLIQKKINPSYSGVLFTESPLDPEKMAIEFVDGHCEKLVKGEVTPRSLQVQDRYTDKETQVNFDPLIEMSQKIERHFSSPQDIEWAYKDNKFWIVQSRPITTGGRKIYWTNTNMNENYPGVISPMLFSIAKTSYYHYFKNICLAFGFISKKDQYLEQEFSHIVGQRQGRIYYNMTNIAQIIDQTALSSFLQKSFNHFIGFQKESTGSKKGRLAFGSKLSQKLAFFLRFLCRYQALKKDVQTFESRVDSFHHDCQQAKSLSQNINTFFDIRFFNWKEASFADFYAMIFHGLLGRLCKKTDPKNYFKWHNLLIQGIPDLISKTPSVEIYKILAMIRQDEEYRRIFKKNQKEILDFLNRNSENDPLAKKFFAYIKNWGFRCSGELMLTHGNFITDPEKLIKVILSNLQHSSQNPEHLFASELKKYEAGLKEFKALMWFNHKTVMGKFFMTRLSLWIIQGARTAIGYRERVRLKQALAYHLLSDLLNKKGQQLVDAHVLSDKTDIFYLTHQQLGQLIDNKIDLSQLKSIVQKRKDIEALQKKQEVPNDFYTLEGSESIYSLDRLVDEGSENTLSGLPACSGIVKGPAKVIASIDEIDKIRAGDILVTKQTDPGWISVFSIISGIVIENGGMLSHGAIVAREFGIPAVVGVPKATDIIANHQILVVDGNLGVVEL